MANEVAKKKIGVFENATKFDASGAVITLDGNVNGLYAVFSANVKADGTYDAPKVVFPEANDCYNKCEALGILDKIKERLERKFAKKVGMTPKFNTYGVEVALDEKVDFIAKPRVLISVQRKIAKIAKVVASFIAQTEKTIASRTGRKRRKANVVEVEAAESIEGVSAVEE